MQIISPFYTRKSYTKEAVNLFIDQYGYNVKYFRKNFIPVNIYRYYEKLQTGKKKLYLFFPHSSSVENKNHWYTFLNWCKHTALKNVHLNIYGNIIVLNYNFLFFYDVFYYAKLLLFNFEAISFQPTAISLFSTIIKLMAENWRL